MYIYMAPKSAPDAPTQPSSTSKAIIIQRCMNMRVMKYVLSEMDWCVESLRSNDTTCLQWTLTAFPRSADREFYRNKPSAFLGSE